MRESRDFVLPDLTEIISGILALAAGEKEAVPVGRIHATLYEMRPHEPILAGLRFSLTGDVCYSRSVDQAVRNLVAWGALEIVDDSAVAVANGHAYRAYLSKSLSSSQLRDIHSTSLRYHDRLRRAVSAAPPSASQAEIPRVHPFALDQRPPIDRQA